MNGLNKITKQIYISQLSAFPSECPATYWQMHEIHVHPFFESFSPAPVAKYALKRHHCRYKNFLSFWHMLCNTQQLMTTSDRFSILWSTQFRRHLHLAFKIAKARSTATFAEDKNLLNFFCSWDKLKLLGNGFTNQVFDGYAPSPIRRVLILYPSVKSVGSVSKMLRSA